VHWAIFVSLSEDVQCVCRLGVIVSDVSDMLLGTQLEASFCLSDVRPVASVTLDFVDSAFVIVLKLLFDLEVFVFVTNLLSLSSVEPVVSFQEL
jgi:hypothetical protein